MDWHRRLGHINFGDLFRLKNELQIKATGQRLECEVCLLAKCNRLPFQHRKTKTTAPLELIHTDTSGTIRVPNIHNATSFLIFIDDFTRYAEVFLLKNKSEVLNHFKEFKARVENRLKAKIIRLRSDNGTEYTNKLFTDFCNTNGIEQQFTNVNTPQQNGIAERFNRVIKEGSIALLVESKLSTWLWPYAVLTTVYNRNRSPSSAIQFKTPYELWFGTKSDYTNMRTFGSKVVIRKLSTNSKFDVPGLSGIFVGSLKTSQAIQSTFLLKNVPFKVVK
jgi:hypothetical protein